MKIQVIYFAIIALLLLLIQNKTVAQTEYPKNDLLNKRIIIAGDSIMKDAPTISQAEVISQLIEKPLTTSILLKTRPYSKKLSGQDIYLKAKPASLIIGMIHRGIKDTSSMANLASGYVIDGSGIGVTNYHVMLSYGYWSPEGKHGLIAQNGNGKNFAVSRILFASAQNDIVVFQLKLAGNEEIPSLSLAPKDAGIGADVYVLGNPNGVFFHLTKGSVANKYSDRVQTLNSSLFNYRNTMAITSDYGTGSSGGPVLDEYGNVIGTVSSTRAILSEGTGRNVPQMTIKNTIPVSTLKALIAGSL